MTRRVSREARRATERITQAFGSARIFWFVIALALGCALFLVSQGLQPCDDAYITFRHVKNLLEHGRPAWNLAGDPVLGSTSPAFLLVLAVFCKALGLDQIDRAALYLNAVFHFVIVVLTYLVARDLVRRVLPAILLALLVGLNTVNVYVFSEGFENAMLVASILGALYFARVGRDACSLGLASLAPLIRPEGILLTPLVWGYILLHKRFNKRLLLAFLPIPLLWLAFSTAYYGSPVPHSLLAAKKFPLVYQPYAGSEVSMVDRLPEVFSHTAELWRDAAGPLLLTGSTAGEGESAVQMYRQWIMLAGLPLAVLSVIARPDGRIIYLLFAPLFLFLYGWIGHTRPWYFPWFVTFSIVLLFAGWIRAIDWGLRRVARRTGPWISRPRVAVSLSLVLFLVFASANSYSVNHGAYRHSRKGWSFRYTPGANCGTCGRPSGITSIERRPSTLKAESICPASP